MPENPGNISGSSPPPEAGSRRGKRKPFLFLLLFAGLCLTLMSLPTPAGLPVAGQRVLAVAVLIIGLWCTKPSQRG